MVLFCSVVHAFTFNRLLVLLTPPPLLPECKMRIKNTHPPEPPKKPTTELYKMLSTQLSFRIKRGSDVMKAHSLSRNLHNQKLSPKNKTRAPYKAF